jgi:hypothetical protein
MRPSPSRFLGEPGGETEEGQQEGGGFDNSGEE